MTFFVVQGVVPAGKRECPPGRRGFQREQVLEMSVVRGLKRGLLQHFLELVLGEALEFLSFGVRSDPPFARLLVLRWS